MSQRVLRVGVIGLSRAFTLMLPTLVSDERIALVAAADLRPDARDAFVAEFGGRAYEDAPDLCADPDVELVYVATPHQFHAQHVLCAAKTGKHILVEKPMAVTLAHCQEMIAAARAAAVQLIVGHSHSFDLPIQRTRALVDSGAFGRVRMITALNYTDFLYRPRRPEELDTAQGGGVLFSQGAHQVDIVRLLGGGLVRSVRAATGAWDANRPSEGAFSALLTFADGACASLTYSGYAHYDSDELVGWINEMGFPKDSQRYGAARRALREAEDEASLKEARAYGSRGAVAPSLAPDTHEHFGMIVVSCERGDLRPLPNGVMIYGDDERRFEALSAPTVPRKEVIDEVYAAIVDNRLPLHSGEWSMATLEVCRAILESSAAGKDVFLSHQVAPSS